MKPPPPQRKPLRLKRYDYSQNGAYFITICCDNYRNLFGNIHNDAMILSEYGKIVQNEWLKTIDLRDNLVLDEFVVMPNHFHAIVNNVGAHRMRPNREYPQVTGACDAPLQNSGLGDIVRGYKAAVTSQISKINGGFKQKIWQRNYYEHIIRDESDLNDIREYIINNPINWKKDKLFVN